MKWTRLSNGPAALLLAGMAFSSVAACTADEKPQAQAGEAAAAAPLAQEPKSPRQEAGGPPMIGEPAPDFTLESLSGEKVQLSKVNEQGPVVLVVLRGFPGYQ
jgi:cytochrome oxidase Cu insertion factor (SCO1/SenC/PrrC family)